MKRSLLIAAVATLGAGAAMAQSSVTVYGRLNLTVERTKVELTGAGSTTTTDLNNNSSRIGFRGVEDLGGGLKAGFVIEHGFNPDTGTTTGTRFWGRESQLYLEGGFGKIHLGNMPASVAYFATADYVSMHNHDTGTSSDALYSFVSTGQLQNAVAYTSPTFGGANFAIEYGLKEGVLANSPMAAAVNWDSGPLHLGLGFEKLGDAKSLALRALYEMGPFTFGGYYERGSGSNEVNNFRLAAMYTMGASEFHVNVGRRGDTNDFDNTDAKQFTLAYNYNLSKRTKVYTYYTMLDAGVEPLIPGGEFEFRSFAVGIRHNF